MRSSGISSTALMPTRSGRERAAELVHVDEPVHVLPVDEELHDDRRIDRVAADGDEVADVLQHLVEQRGLDLHHPRVVGGVGGVEREDHLARLVVDQPVRDLAGQRDAVRREVVDDDVLRGEVVEDVEDVAVEERIAAAGEAHGLQPALDQLVDEIRELRERDRLLRAQVLLVAEVAGHVAAVGEVELGVHRARASAGWPRSPR